MNHFEHPAAARRYAAARPYHHDAVVERIRSILKITSPMPRVLDVGCGTGMSSVALKAIARSVTALDCSREMLVRAVDDVDIEYIHAPAEDTGLPGGAFKLATVSSAFHWFDRERFLAEAARVLTRRGWLVVYNNAFHARMRENARFHKAFRDAYPKRYPTPVRDWRPLTTEAVAPFGFDFVHEEKYTNDVAFSPEELVDYLSTQSNIIAAVEGGSETLSAARAWLLTTFGPYFTAPVCTFQFGGKITFLRKRGE
jgi:ubiquinone/menaquinone biosynthesis C-methylase UbiE